MIISANVSHWHCDQCHIGIVVEHTFMQPPFHNARSVCVCERERQRDAILFSLGKYALYTSQ